MDGLTSQIFLITSTLVSVLFGLNVLLPLRFERVQGWPMPGEPQLSDPKLSPA